MQVFHGSGSVKIVKNNLAGSLKLNDFSMQLKWSNIGNLRMFLIQVVQNYHRYSNSFNAALDALKLIQLPFVFYFW